MRLNTHKCLRPWLLCVAAGLAATILGYVMRDSAAPVNEGAGFCTLPLAITLQSVLIGCIGAYYRNWRITLIGAVGMFVAQHFVQRIWLENLVSMDLVVFTLGSGIALSPAVLVHSIWHAVVIDLRNRQLKPGHCTGRGRDVNGHSVGTCPQCGEVVQSVSTQKK